MDLLGCVHPRETIASQLLDLPYPFTVGHDLFPAVFVANAADLLLGLQE